MINILTQNEKEPQEIEKLMVQLLNLVHLNEDDSLDFTQESKEIIHKISSLCKETKIGKKALDEKGLNYAKDMSAEDIYLDLLNKIACAPTNMHMLITIRLLVPLLSEKIEQLEV